MDSKSTWCDYLKDITRVRERGFGYNCVLWPVSGGLEHINIIRL